MKGFTGVAFVGCTHTVTPELLARLDRVLEYTDEFEHFALVFGGDLSSSRLLDDMKVHFYNTKRNIDGSIDLFVDLVQANGGFANLDAIQPWINTVRGEEYIGPWIGKYASARLRAAIEQGFIDNTTAICDTAKKFRDRGARVMVCGGNWEDVQNSRDTMGMPDIPDHVPVLRDMGAEVFTEIGHALVGNVDLIFLPYWELERFGSPEINLRLIAAIQKCSPNIDYSRVAVAHAEPNWAVHHRMNPQVSPERAKIIANLGTCLAALKPDQVVYPHQHSPIQSSDGHVLGDNVKYLLRIEGGTVKLVEDPTALGGLTRDTIVASFIPFQKVGLLSTTGDNDQEVGLRGGPGKLIEVLSI